MRFYYTTPKQRELYKAYRDKVSPEKETVKENQIEETNYKVIAETISYDNLIRNPDQYKGEIIKITVKISQIMGGGLLSDEGYAGKQNGNEWYISYKLPEGSSRIIENDTVTFYGEYMGVEEMTRALTNTKTYIPRIKAKYHE